jgi:hypothetical protein
MEEEAKREGLFAAYLAVANNRIWHIAATLLTSGELVESSHVKEDVDEMY